MSLTIEHTHSGGTLLNGTSRGDGSAEVLRTRPGGSYWKWSRNLGAWYIVHSRDSLPNRYRINATAEALRSAGFDVELEVDETVRSTAEVVADQRERAGDRAEALHAKAERKQGEADAAYAGARQIADMIPMGQPILVGHHSERRHRKDLDRIQRGYEKSWEASDEAKDAARRASISEARAAGRESRVTVANRVEKLRAEVAKDLRSLWGVPADMRHLHWTVSAALSAKLRGYGGPVDPDSDYGQRLTARIVENTDARLYWAEVLEGMPTGVDPATVSKGDTVKWRGTWYPVKRVNRKTVTVSNWLDVPSMTYGLPWAEVTDHRPVRVETPAVELDCVQA